MKFIDLTGHRFGRLVAIKVVRQSGSLLKYECQCDCGATTLSTAKNLRGGNALSCGCFRTDRVKEVCTTHGMKGTRTYRIWRNMRDRCERHANQDFKHYGGRGITICERWNEFANFLEDMGEAPEGLQIDRTDNNKGYYKENCRWVTPAINCNNKRNTVLVDFNGELLPVVEVAKRLGIKSKALKYRLQHWPLHEALTRPLRSW